MSSIGINLDGLLGDGPLNTQLGYLRAQSRFPRIDDHFEPLQNNAQRLLTRARYAEIRHGLPVGSVPDLRGRIPGFEDPTDAVYCNMEAFMDIREESDEEVVDEGPLVEEQQVAETVEQDVSADEVNVELDGAEASVILQQIVSTEDVSIATPALQTQPGTVSVLELPFTLPSESSSSGGSSAHSTPGLETLEAPQADAVQHFR